MKSVTHSIFKTFLLSALVVAQMHFAYAQTASILPPAKTTFLDANGKPLTAGTVESFIPTTSTHKTTWQDAAETIPNANPLTLDAAGRALLLGSGSYRQLVKDRLGNTIWDQVTSSTGSGGGGGTVATGDGDLVGTIKPWAGMTAPNQYVFTYGQELSRITYSALFTAITSTQAIFCNSGSPILSGLSDTSNFWIGMSIELSCVAPGFTTIISKTATTVTMAINANVTTGTNAVFFPWGRGNGSTTFNMPDFRGFAIAGNNIMGGVSGSQLTTTFFGATDPNSSGAAGGSQSKTLLLANEVPYTPVGTILTVAPQNNFATGTGTEVIGFTAGATNKTILTGAVASNSGATSTFTGTAQGGGQGSAASAVVAAGGAGYTNGAQTLIVSGGTCSTQPQFTVTVVANAITAPVLLNAGLCSVAPANPAATTGGGGTGGTLTVTYGQAPFATIQPTKTSNYIIKVLPDDNSATASGVTALGGMTGSIACGAGLLCTGNTVSVTFPAVPAPTAVTLGGVFSKTCSASNWFNTLDNTGTFGCSQPNFTDLAGSIAIGQIPNNLITYAKLQQGSARSVLGVTGNAGANLADMQGTANQWFGADSAGTSVAFRTLAGDCTGPITAIICANVNGVALTTNSTAAVGQLPGTTTNDNAAAGKVGEYIELDTVSGSAVSLTTGSPANVGAGISLTAGDWDVSVDTVFNPAGTTTVTNLVCTSNSTSATIGTSPNHGATFNGSWTFTTGQAQVIFCGTRRYSLASTTTIFMVVQAAFGTSTMQAYGTIWARRRR